MAKTCKCKKDFTVTCRDYLGDGKHSEVYNKVLYKMNEVYFFTNKGKEYYVSTEEQYLRDIKRWNIYVEELTEEQFNENFSFEGKPLNNKPDELFESKYIKMYNDLVDKLQKHELTGEEKILFSSLEYKLGFGESAGFFNYEIKQPKNNKFNYGSKNNKKF